MLGAQRHTWHCTTRTCTPCPSQPLSQPHSTPPHSHSHSQSPPFPPQSPDPHATPDDIHMHPVPRGRPDARGSGARTLSVPGKRMTARDRSVSSRKQGPGRAEGGGRDRDRDRDSATSRDGSEAAARRRYTGEGVDLCGCLEIWM